MRAAVAEFHFPEKLENELEAQGLLAKVAVTKAEEKAFAADALAVRANELATAAVAEKESAVMAAARVSWCEVQPRMVHLFTPSAELQMMQYPCSMWSDGPKGVLCCCDHFS